MIAARPHRLHPPHLGPQRSSATLNQHPFAVRHPPRLCPGWRRAFALLSTMDKRLHCSGSRMTLMTGNRRPCGSTLNFSTASVFTGCNYHNHSVLPGSGTCSRVEIFLCTGSKRSNTPILPSDGTCSRVEPRFGAPGGGSQLAWMAPRDTFFSQSSHKCHKLS